MRIISILLFVFFSTQLSAQWFSPAGPLEKQNVNIGNNDDYSGFSILDSAIIENRVFIVGENSQYAVFNSKFEFKLLSYLNHKFGLKHYLIETGPSKAMLINKYVNTGDTSIEKLLKSVSSVKYMKLYKNLKKWNVKLADSLKIQIHGVDIERYSTLPVVRISQLLPEQNIPLRLRVGVEAMEGAAKYIISKGLEDFDKEQNTRDREQNDYFYSPSNFSIKASAIEFLHFYDSLKSDFNSWLGKDAMDLEQAMGWLRQSIQWREYSYNAFQSVWREETVFRNVNEALVQYPNDKFFGQFGRCHIYKGKLKEGCGFYDYSGLVHKLKTLPESKGKKVFNLALFMDRAGDKGVLSLNNGTEVFKTELQELIDEVPNDSTAIFNSKLHDSKSLLGDDFDFVLIHRGEIVSDYDGDSATGSGSNDNWDDTKEKDETRLQNRGYVALGWIKDLPNLNPLNTALFQNGLKPITSMQSMGISGSMLMDNQLFQSFSLAWGVNNPSTFKHTAINYSLGYNIFPGNTIRFTGEINAGYILNKIISPYDNGLQPFVSTFKSPRIITNPATLLGLGSTFMIDLHWIYLYAHGGYQQDLSQQRWRNSGSFTGNTGKLSVTGWNYSFGAGFSIPMGYNRGGEQ